MGRDRTGPPASRGSWLAFDSGVASDLGLDSDSVLRVGYACFAVGVVAGLALVLLSRNLLLLAFGLAGALLAWSYSSPPLKLSYRGIGEVSTFLAFGPIMTIGATVAFGGAGMFASVLASIVLGFLAAAISFARYFPNRGEDAAKGKRTPVVRLSPHAARSLFVGLVFAPVVVAILWIPFVGGFLWVVVLLVCLFVLIRLFPASPTGRFGRIIAVAIATHTLVAAALVTDLLFRL